MLPSHAFVLLALASSLNHHLVSVQSLSPQCSDGFSFAGMDVASNVTQCKKLRALNAELGWSYHNTTPNATLDIIFGALPPSGPNGWVAWGVNPGPRAQMVGTRALIAFVRPDGTPTVLPYNVTGDNKGGCKLLPSAVEFGVDNLKASFSGGLLVLSARLSLSTEVYNVSRLNHVWQVGSRIVGEEPKRHAMGLQNLDSREVIDLTSGHSFGRTRDRLRISHGVLSVIGWGFLLPIGVIITRYFRGSPFKIERWFRVHVSIQITAFCIGTTAWAIGLSLQTSSRRYKTFMHHKSIGITIFCIAFLQMVALWLKPKKMDKYRKYWSIYHHFMGYSLLTLIAVNIFKGFDILQPPSEWRWAYIAILVALCCIALLLEINIWIVVYLKQKKSKDDKSQTGQT